MRPWILWALLSCAAGAAAQACPASDAKNFSRPSAPQTLHGRLLLHQNLRTWFGLQLEKPVCGQKEIQVIASPDAEIAAYKKIWKDLEAVRGCTVELVSPIDLSPTGYYSTDLYVVATQVKTDASCVRSEPLPDYSQLKPAASIRSYRVVVHLPQTDTPITARVQSAGKQLKPWQVYAGTFLSGGLFLWLNCAEEFALSDPLINGRPVKDALMDGRLGVDAEPGGGNYRASYQCTRIPRKQKQ